MVNVIVPRTNVNAKVDGQAMDARSLIVLEIQTAQIEVRPQLYVPFINSSKVY